MRECSCTSFAAEHLCVALLWLASRGTRTLSRGLLEQSPGVRDVGACGARPKTHSIERADGAKPV